ncbi:MAG: DUF4124 domain-containing protein [Kangiellaceae bacterium]|nr:DUF4124 domain-containing protein [Kangiellaceae bacterium]
MKSSTHLTRKLVILLLAFIGIMTLPVQSQVYKWVDENGKVHFSDKPIDEKSQKVVIKKQPSKSQIKEAKQRASEMLRHQRKVNQINDEEILDSQLARHKKEREQTKLKQACNEAKREKINLSRGFRSYTENEKGERYFYSDQEKTDLITELEKAIQKNCSSIDK